MKSNEQYMPADPPPYPTSGGGAPPPPHVYSQQPQGVFNPGSFGPPPYQQPLDQPYAYAQPQYQLQPDSGQWQPPNDMATAPPHSPSQQYNVYAGGQTLGGAMPPPSTGYYVSRPGESMVNTGYSAYLQQMPGGAPAAVTVVHVQGLGPYPVQTTCGACHAQVTTTTKPNSGLLTWLIAGGLCLLGCWLGCCLIPFCVDACQDVEHSCPNCKASIGAFRRL